MVTGMVEASIFPSEPILSVARWAPCIGTLQSKISSHYHTLFVFYVTFCAGWRATCAFAGMEARTLCSHNERHKWRGRTKHYSQISHVSSYSYTYIYVHVHIYTHMFKYVSRRRQGPSTWMYTFRLLSIPTASGMSQWHLSWSRNGQKPDSRMLRRSEWREVMAEGMVGEWQEGEGQNARFPARAVYVRNERIERRCGWHQSHRRGRQHRRFCKDWGQAWPQ